MYDLSDVAKQHRKLEKEREKREKEALKDRMKIIFKQMGIKS